MIVTSFGPEGYESYGKQFIESYYAQGNTHPLAVYVEGEDQVVMVRDNHEAHQIFVRDLLLIPGVQQTLDEIGKNPVMRGMIKDNEGNDQHTWRLDAFRYCRKVFAFCEEISNAMQTDEPRNPVYWLDADITFTGKLPDNFDEVLMPEPFALSFLGRSNMHSETGFMGADAKHPKMQMFVALYQGLYATGAFADLREWHDCYIFDHARKLTLMPEIDLTTDPESLYPFDSSVLSNWMTHHKGPARKNETYGTETAEEGAQDER